MKKVIDFGKYKGASYSEVDIGYLVYISDQIRKDKNNKKSYNKKLLSEIDYWLDERHLEYEKYDRKEAWSREIERNIRDEITKHNIDMNLSTIDIARFIIGTYGFDKASLISDEIKKITEDRIQIDMPDFTIN